MWMTFTPGARLRAARSASEGSAEAQAVDLRQRIDAFAVLVAEQEEGKEGAVLVKDGDGGAFALIAHQPLFAGERVEGLAQGALADSVFLGQRDFTGKEASRPPFSGDDAVKDGFLHLLVEGGERQFR